MLPLVEYLVESQGDLSSWENLVFQLQQFNIQLSSEDCQTLLQLILPLLQDQHDLYKTKVYLNCFIKLIEIDHNFKALVGQYEASGLSKALSLYNFLQADYVSLFSVGANAFRILISYEHIYIMGINFALRGMKVKPNVEKVLNILLKQRVRFDDYSGTNINTHSVYAIINEVAHKNDNNNVAPPLSSSSTTSSSSSQPKRETPEEPVQVIVEEIKEEELTIDQLIQLIEENGSNEYLETLPEIHREKFLVVKFEESCKLLSIQQAKLEDVELAGKEMTSFFLSRQKKCFHNQSMIKKETLGAIQNNNVLLQLVEEAFNKKEQSLNDLHKIYNDIQSLLSDQESIFQLVKIHQQFMAVYSSEVSICFVGLLKAGKSATINSILGINISPSTVQVMTSIPIRYLHTPKSNKIELFIPFNKDLNKSVELIREVSNLPEIQSFSNKLNGELKELLLAINQNTIRTFEEKYVFNIDGNNRLKAFQNKQQAVKELNTLTSQVHQLFRLCALEESDKQVFPQAFESLPTEWKHGLEHLMTVNMNFDGLKGASISKFSVIDTPGTNEANVRKLNMQQTLYDIAGSSQVVCLVVSPTTIRAEGLAPTREYIQNIRQEYNALVMVCITRKDELGDEEQGNIANDVSNLLNIEARKIFLISPDFYLCSTEMKKTIEALGTKPQSENVLNWIRHFCSGVSQNSRIQNYGIKTIQEILDESDDSIEESGFNSLLEEINKVSQNGFKIISLGATRKSIYYLRNIKRELEIRIASVQNTESLLQQSRNAIKTLRDLRTEVESIRSEIHNFLDSLFFNLKKCSDVISSFFNAIQPNHSGDHLELFRCISREFVRLSEKARSLTRGETCTFSNRNSALQEIQSIIQAVERASRNFVNSKLNTSVELKQLNRKVREITQSVKNFFTTTRSDLPDIGSNWKVDLDALNFNGFSGIDNELDQQLQKKVERILDSLPRKTGWMEKVKLVVNPESIKVSGLDLLTSCQDTCKVVLRRSQDLVLPMLSKPILSIFDCLDAEIRPLHILGDKVNRDRQRLIPLKEQLTQVENLMAFLNSRI